MATEDRWWKPLNECPQYKNGMITPFIATRALETCDPSAYPSSAYPLDLMKLFLKQVRESRGYDVDICPPGFPFSQLSERMMKTEEYGGYVDAKINFVVEEINTQAQKYGEKYVYVSFKKVVEAFPHRCTFLTFVVREVTSNAEKTVQALVYAEVHEFELLEWRFKPDPENSSENATESLKCAAAASVLLNRSIIY